MPTAPGPRSELSITRTPARSPPRSSVVAMGRPLTTRADDRRRARVASVLLALIAGEHGDDAVHRRAEVPVRVLDAPVRTGRLWLVVIVQHGVKPAVVDERPGMAEMQRQRSGLSAVAAGPGQQHVEALVAGRVEGVVAH